VLDLCQIQHPDEIGDLPLETQPKLLRFLDSKEIHPLGEATPQRVAVRIVAATHADLERMMKDGRFREASVTFGFARHRYSASRSATDSSGVPRSDSAEPESAGGAARVT